MVQGEKAGKGLSLLHWVTGGWRVQGVREREMLKKALSVGISNLSLPVLLLQEERNAYLCQSGFT